MCPKFLCAKKLPSPRTENQAGRLYGERTLVLSSNQRSGYALSQELARLGTSDAGGRRCRDDRVRAAWPTRPADRLFDCRGGSRDDHDRILRILPDVRPGGAKIAITVSSLARASRCDPRLIEAARSGDANALVSLITAAQPDVRRYAARNCRAADVDDAVQETLLLLYRRGGALRAVASFLAGVFLGGRRACPRLPRVSAGGSPSPPHGAGARAALRPPEDFPV